VNTDPGTLIVVILAVIAGIVWLVRLEGRINGHDREMSQVRDDIAYIRDRIDRAIDHR